MALTYRHKQPLFLLYFFLLFFVLPCSALPSDPAVLASALLKFKDSLTNTAALSSWDEATPPCNWKGVFCSDGYVRSIQVPDMGLQGTVDVGLLKDLKEELRSLNFADNSFEGPFPDLKMFSALKSAFLSNNRFSGQIPDDGFRGMASLKKLHLARNGFTGPIPTSLTDLPHLIELKLEENKFEGEIPDFQNPNLKVCNVSYNNLVGEIPASLSKMDPSFFAGNKGLSPSQPATPTPGDSGSKSKGSSTSTIIFATVGSLLGLALIMAVIFFLCRRKRRNESTHSIETPLPLHHRRKSGTREMEPASDGSVGAGGRKAAESTKLSFVRDDRERFELPDLLKSSAEILGTGCFGSSYRAGLPSGQMMVVKRFKKMNNVGREEFQEHMRRLGRLTHPNLLPLVAYYYRKEEKLLISDFMERGNLAVHLHGYQDLGQPSLDWATRLKVIKGVAKGLGYLYKELPSLVAPHGHMKSSNILLNQDYEPLITDYGLIPVINQDSAQERMVAYKSPEFLQQGRIMKKTDVWGLGILILEILTGKIPPADLASWVSSIVGSSEDDDDNNKSDIFDKDMGGTSNSQGEMVKLLRIAVACCEEDVEKRVDLKEAIEKIEELKERDGGGGGGGEEDYYSSCASVRSSRGKSDDFVFT